MGNPNPRRGVWPPPGNKPEELDGGAVSSPTTSECGAPKIVLGPQGQACA
eukprot:CAMPEP_0203965024 /NCGR_PEP_ID=MMETSP0359-20131031/94622_1 /ASSEMBLY_ACC=CAM_ASM_000338 /TAXON_ID=268821 /ORGANISM="Scrippsiella Hangoei, Strain SHTV-5" /LENGTH=49 /DNA_ID= /DNA_START= /DNA_END= /DNA_ORIENTATION=